MHIIGKTSEEVDKYLFDYCSILHLIFGILGYVIINSILLLFLIELASCLISCIIVILSSVFWELIENSVLIEIKINKRTDNVINSQGDTLSVFLGSIIGCLAYLTSLIIVIFIMGALFVLYVLAMILTRKNLSP